MTGVLARVSGWLLAPAAGSPQVAPRAVTAERPHAPQLALVAAAADAHALGAALALRATRGTAGGAVWTGPSASPPRVVGGMATPAARRLAASFVARDLRAAAAGRLVTVALDGDDQSSGADAARVLGVAGDVPVVL